MAAHRHSASLPSQRQSRMCDRNIGTGWVGIRRDRKIEARVGMFALTVCFFARGLDGADQGEIHPNSVDVNHFISTMAGGDSRANW
eukprot:4866882-Pleurochrysis_carterae.AAC.5